MFEETDLAHEEAGGSEWFLLARWITRWYLGLSKCIAHPAERVSDARAHARKRTHTHTHTPPTSDPRMPWVGVEFQLAAQSYHCAPVNTMKTKLTHR